MLLLSLAACSGGTDDPVTGFRDNNPDGFAAVVLPEPYALEDATLTDRNGDARDVVADLDRPITLVFFGYTHCPDVCQVIMNDITAALARLDEREREQIGMLFITSDPARDDSATLKRYLSRFNPDFEGLTGPLDLIKRVGRSVGVDVTKGDRLPSGGYAVAHGTHIIGVRPDGSAPLIWTDGTSSADLAADLTKALTEGIPEVGSDS